MCDGATLSHVKHKLVPSASLLQIVVLTFKMVRRTIAGVALVVCVTEQLCHT